MTSSSRSRATGTPATANNGLPPPGLRRRFRRRLLGWYRRNGRNLPWRNTKDPYHILVSEMMLQQTQVDRVLPKYEQWLRKYPSLEALAAAKPGEVGRTWRPLGYNARPKRLHAIAREVVARYDAKLPSDEQTLRSFKGIGAYTAGAVQSFAFGRRAPIVDTNVARLLSRIFVNARRGRPDNDGRGGRGGQGDNAAATKKHLWALSEALLPRRDVFDFNQALMDLGAVVCVARRPRCVICPMRPICQAYAFGPASQDGTGQREGT
ncbi:MAG: A/G-specific adenine glycosylase [Vicinamibacterales bacterium]|nr:A/G-specific adenine glycosylase [Vicinamibacterales bacterium]